MSKTLSWDKLSDPSYNQDGEPHWKTIGNPFIEINKRDQLIGIGISNALHNET